MKPFRRRLVGTLIVLLCLNSLLTLSGFSTSLLNRTFEALLILAGVLQIVFASYLSWDLRRKKIQYFVLNTSTTLNLTATFFEPGGNGGFKDFSRVVLNASRDIKLDSLGESELSCTVFTVRMTAKQVELGNPDVKDTVLPQGFFIEISGWSMPYRLTLAKLREEMLPIFQKIEKEVRPKKVKYTLQVAGTIGEDYQQMVINRADLPRLTEVAVRFTLERKNTKSKINIDNKGLSVVADDQLSLQSAISFLLSPLA